MLSYNFYLITTGIIMKAFVMKKINETGIVDKEIPAVGPYDALIKTTTTLVCTSDTHHRSWTDWRANKSNNGT